MKNNICPECKTENEPEYEYCKNCGAPLAKQEEYSVEAPVPPAFSAGTDNTVPPCGGNNESPFAQSEPVSIDSNPISHVTAFVGKNSGKIVPKLIGIEKTGAKTSWCWPPFIWGLLLGPVGVMIWFLYRKMYKPACLFGAIAVVTNCAEAVIRNLCDNGTSIIKSTLSYIESATENGTFSLGRLADIYSSGSSIWITLFNTLSNMLSIACAIIAGIFGLYVYKKHIAKTIDKYKAYKNNPGYVRFGLSAVGGTSAGAAIIGAIIVSVISTIPDTVFEVINYVKGA